jgi:hypothetical protein
LRDSSLKKSPLLQAFSYPDPHRPTSFQSQSTGWILTLLTPKIPRHSGSISENPGWIKAF